MTASYDDFDYQPDPEELTREQGIPTLKDAQISDREADQALMQRLSEQLKARFASEPAKSHRHTQSSKQ